MSAPHAPSIPGAEADARPPVPDKALTSAVALLIPALVLTATVVVAMSWAAELPDPVASHFGGDGPDGFSSLGSFVWTGVGIGASLAALGWVIATGLGRAAAARRTGVGTAVGGSLFLATSVLGTLDAQRGLADSAQTGGIDGVVLLCVIVGGLGGALAALLMPGDRPQPATAPVPSTAAQVPLAPQERATWVRRVTGRSMIAVAAAVVAVSAITARVADTPAAAAPLAVVLVVLLAHAQFTVTVDSRGLRVRSLLGFPRLTVPADEVLHAEEVSVSPLREFGGWGYRVGSSGRVGIVVRQGAALQVTRTGGRVYVVTVDDAATGAALLNTLTARTR
ncbi:DUF1648 domain-containing protein [Cellulomonas chengniuliangii]|uniref:DUF1648 domain-containing protein n=1 Tax=Cellulomonas chengniuliangii TaxID=2968084 RepID=UPI001D0F43F4|nr:DUF1648 domain-containing protein [Cellulomonas chengniuliangii]MCC2319376.1 DUF1648 domain-containing protein [Cellulomonas chengniuliangii]